MAIERQTRRGGKTKPGRETRLPLRRPKIRDNSLDISGTESQPILWCPHHLTEMRRAPNDNSSSRLRKSVITDHEISISFAKQ